MKSEKGKTWFLREVAKRANFTIEDVAELWAVMEDLFYERAIEGALELEKSEDMDNYVLNVNGLFGFRVRKMIPHRSYDGLNKRHFMQNKNTYRYYFKPSKKFSDMVRQRLNDLLKAEE